jgi:hypothetical protein
MSSFKGLVEAIDRLLYTVDEWLRFQRGQGRWTFTWKLILGTLWFFVTYVVRFYVNLFLEPQTNPIKHFPVVTVSAKLLLPLSPMLIARGKDLLGGILSPAAVQAVTTFHVALLPGVFGFLAWELKENWRLYQANQPTTLRPDVVGHHGETVRQLLRLGFHSGTIPKLYRKLRRAERRDRGPRTRAAAQRHRVALHGVEESIRHFVDRQLLALLNASRSWGGALVTTGHVALGCQRIKVELRCPQRSDASAWIAFEEQAGWLLAGVPQLGWLTGLSDSPRRALLIALAGWYKLAGVELIREQIEASLGQAAWACDMAGENLTVRTAACRGAVVDRVLPVTPLLFENVAIPWRRWVEVWERDQAGAELLEPFLEGIRLLPPAEPVAGNSPARTVGGML